MISAHGQTHLPGGLYIRNRVYSATITRSAVQVSRQSGFAKSIRSALFFTPFSLFLSRELVIFMHARVFFKRALRNGDFAGQRAVDTNDKKIEKSVSRFGHLRGER